MRGILAAFTALAAVGHCAPALTVAERSGYPTSHDLVVDLGYALYNGTANDTEKLNNWLGMRYGASTEGKNRWQKPQTPPTNRSSVIQANVLGPNCPSGQSAPGSADYNFTGSEDCLVLNVQAPQGAKNLPVFLSIHGGGYGQGYAGQDLTPLINASGNKFVAVVIQYRLAAFGWLSSDSVKKHGVPNAGLWDQHFALEWVQKHISKFGGDPSRVTIQGESAGGGSVMLQAMAFGGSEGTEYFSNAIPESPYLPTQPKYNDARPTQFYLHFAQLAGCYSGDINQVKGADADGKIFKCLVGKDSETLQAASSNVSVTAFYGQWAFIPVTDLDFVRELPSQQLVQGKVNGKRMLTSNNADEGIVFVNNNYTTVADFESFVNTNYPGITGKQFQDLLKHYPVTVTPANQPLYATNGTSTPSALSQSIFATGVLQAVANLYGETTFVCSSYFLGNAYKESYRYQYSIVGATHGADVASYFGPRAENVSPEMESLVMQMYSAFITTNDPSLPNSGIKPLEKFPRWVHGPNEQMVNLNQTGGTPFQIEGPHDVEITEFMEPGLQLDIETVNAYSWEGGRGKRCDFLQSIGSSIPE